MLSENIRRLRESKGLSQGELAVRLNVVRQTVSKWERGLSVPDDKWAGHLLPGDDANDGTCSVHVPSVAELWRNAAGG